MDDDDDREGCGGLSFNINHARPTQTHLTPQNNHTTTIQAEAGAEIVMLDNFDPPGLKQAAEQVKARYPHVTIEASGVRVACVCLVYGVGTWVCSDLGYVE